MKDSHPMSLATAHFIRNNYPDNIQITTTQDGNKWQVDVYLLEKEKVVKHLLTSKPLFRSSGEAKLHAEWVCDSIVNDTTLIEP